MGLRGRSAVPRTLLGVLFVVLTLALCLAAPAHALVHTDGHGHCHGPCAGGLAPDFDAQDLHDCALCAAGPMHATQAVLDAPALLAPAGAPLVAEGLSQVDLSVRLTGPSARGPPAALARIRLEIV